MSKSTATRQLSEADLLILKAMRPDIEERLKQKRHTPAEYIRKDALMKWAKFILKCQEEELVKYNGPSYAKAATIGRIDAYKVLIAKLNSIKTHLK